MTACILCVARDHANVFAAFVVAAVGAASVHRSRNRSVVA